MTGASGGVGRAIAHAFAKRGAHVGLLARGKRGPRRTPSGRSSRSAAQALAVPTDVAEHEQVEAAAEAGRSALRRDRHLGQRRDGDRVRALHRHRAGGVQARDRSHLPRHRVRHDGGAEADDRPRPGQDRAGRLGARLPRDPAAGRLLRREVRDPRLHRLDSHRAAARQEQRCRSRWCSCPASTRRSSTGAARSCPSTRCRCRRSTSPRSPRRPCTGQRITAAASCGSATAPWRRSSAASSRRAFSSTGTWRKTGFSGQQVKGMPIDGERSGQPVRAGRRRGGHARHLRRAGQDTQPPAVGGHAPRRCSAARSPGSPPPWRASARWRASVDERPRRAPAVGAPHVLREYALLADGERGVLVGPRGDFAWMCFPRWDSPAVFSSLDRRPGALRDHAQRTPRMGRLLRAGEPDLAQPLGDRRRR